jgi:hypothetical protein
MNTEQWHLLFYAIATLLLIASFGWGIGCFCYKLKLRRQREDENHMTQKDFDAKCSKNQENCPQLGGINVTLNKILKLSEENSKHTKHLSECFLLYLSQTDVDDGVRTYIEDKLKEQVKQVVL